MRKLLLALAFLGFAGPALAQNTQCSNRPTTDSSNACANTRFVQTAVSPIEFGPSGYALIGNGASIATFQPFTQLGTGATARTWFSKDQDVVSVKDFGATGDGTTDDSTTQQNALTYCITIGCEVYYPPGSYKTTVGLLAPGRIKIRGVGFQGDSGGGFLGSGVSQSTGFKSSTIVCAVAINCFTAVTNLSVQIQDIQFTYPSTPTPGTVGILIQAAAGGTSANTQSTIHHVMVTGADTGIRLTNALDFRINNNDILYSVAVGIDVNSPNYPSFNQASICDNEIWGAANAGFLAHIRVQAGGDLRICNNKLTTGGVNTNGIAFLGAAAGSQSMEPINVVGNSIEGPQNCITFSTANASFTASQVTITGNQLWCGGKSILVNTFGASQYVLALVISSNVLTVNGGAGVNPLQIDNVSGASIDANTFACSGGCSASTAITLGSFTTNVVVGSGNSYDVGYTTKVNNIAGAVNTILTTPFSVAVGGTACSVSSGTCFNNISGLSGMAEFQGRLTLTSGTPVLTGTVATATSIFYTPYRGNVISTYTGTNMLLTSTSELSVALGANWATNSNYDFYLGFDSSTLRLCSGAAWTSDTARNETLVRVNGVLLNNASMTCRYNNSTTFTCAAQRCSYIGTMRTGAAGQTNYIFGASGVSGIAASFGVWNMYNRVGIGTLVQDSGASWTQAATSIRSADQSTAMRCSFIQGQQEDEVYASYQAMANAVSATGQSQAGIGLDSTSAFSGPIGFGQASLTTSLRGEFETTTLGWHFLQALEGTSTGGTTTWNGASGSIINTGLICRMKG